MPHRIDKDGKTKAGTAYVDFAQNVGDVVPAIVVGATYLSFTASQPDF